MVVMVVVGSWLLRHISTVGIVYIFYLEAAARMELARISCPRQNPIANVDTGKEREPSTNYLDPLEGSYHHLLSFPPHHLIVFKAICPVAFAELKKTAP